MIGLSLAGVAIILILGIVFAVRQARRRRNYNPNGIYPLW